MVDWLMEQLITWIAGFILDALNTVIDILRNTALFSPNVTTLPQVTLWGASSASRL